MEASVCITTFNEEKTIRELLDSIQEQTLIPEEIVIVDGGSTDQTLEIIKHFAKKDKTIRFTSEKLSRSKGRNLAVDMARNKIVAMTDAGCVARRDWLEKLTEPFANQKVDIVAGFYEMTGETALQKAFSVFMGVHPNEFGKNFLPSTRSIAFTKEAFGKVGGFPENLDDTAEDTAFNFNSMKMGLKYAHAKDAIVEWQMPKTLVEGITKIYKYAKGDAKTKTWNHPNENLVAHNIKVLLVFARYIAGIFLLLLSQLYPPFLLLLITLVIAYSAYAFRKTYKKFENLEVGLWGLALQYATDIAVMRGFWDGYRRKS